MVEGFARLNRVISSHPRPPWIVYSRIPIHGSCLPSPWIAQAHGGPILYSMQYCATAASIEGPVSYYGVLNTAIPYCNAQSGNHNGAHREHRYMKIMNKSD